MRNHHTLLVSSLLAERSKALAVVGYASILADSHTGPFVNFGRGQKVLPVHCPDRLRSDAEICISAMQMQSASFCIGSASDLVQVQRLSGFLTFGVHSALCPDPC